MLPQIIIASTIPLIVSPTIRKETVEFGSKILKGASTLLKAIKETKESDKE